MKTEKIIKLANENSELAVGLLQIAIAHLTNEQKQKFFECVNNRGIIENKIMIERALGNGFNLKYFGVASEFFGLDCCNFSSLVDAHDEAEASQKQTGCKIEWDFPPPAWGCE